MWLVIVERYKQSWFDRYVRFSIPIALAAFTCSLFVNFWAIRFATERTSNSVTDIILSNTPVFNVDELFVYGTFVFALYTMVILLMHPKRIPFGLHALTLFYLIRSIFTILTHIAPFESTYYSDFGPAITHAFFGGDLFFSGHTGMPFLGALAFWHIPRVRNVFLFGSFFFAVIVLLGHLHYSIDVLAAFFITYGIYHIALWLFPKERALFLEE